MKQVQTFCSEQNVRRLVPYQNQTRWKICYEVVPVVKCAENISETGSEEYRTLVLTHKNERVISPVHGGSSELGQRKVRFSFLRFHLDV